MQSTQIRLDIPHFWRCCRCGCLKWQYFMRHSSRIEYWWLIGNAKCSDSVRYSSLLVLLLSLLLFKVAIFYETFFQNWNLIKYMQCKVFRFVGTFLTLLLLLKVVIFHKTCLQNWNLIKCKQCKVLRFA